MSAGTLTPRRSMLRWLVMPAMLTSLAAGLGSVLPAPHAAADSAQLGRSSIASPEGSASPVTAYVTNEFSGTVTPIATATNTAGPPIMAGSYPENIVITPDGKTLYVASGSYYANGSYSYGTTVTPIATATNTAAPPITVGSQPYGMAITPDGKTVYVANYGSGTVTPIATATNTAGPPITVGSGPFDIAITPDGKTAYVANLDSGTVTPIATATNTAGPPITVGSVPLGPFDIVITPDGKTAYVTDSGSGTVTPIATATNTAGPPITVGSYPENIAITPDGKTAYVTDYDSGTVTPIATATNTAGPPITTGTAPERIVITPDGKTAYVTNEVPGTVTPIATATNTAGPPITVGKDPMAIAITPDGETVYVANLDSGTVTPIRTATNTAGPPITVGSYPYAIALATTARPPAFTSTATATVAFGAAFTFTVTTTGDPTPRITRTGRLPSGVRFSDNRDGTATIAGTPAKAATGLYPLTLTAKNKNGTATQTFSLTVTRAPVIKEIRTIMVRVGAALSRTVRAMGYPLPALAESGPLPGGLSFTDNGNGTAVIAGTPAAGSGGRYPITITVTNTSGTATRHFTIVVSQRRRR
jgi:YVTN family beta-propeller protein